MSATTGPAPGWAVHLQALCRAIARHPQQPATRESRTQAWQLVYFTLGRYLRYHAARLAPLAPEDLEDISSQKTLELMGKVDTSSGRLLDLEAAEMPAFLSTVARNGLVSWLKRRHRSVQPLDEVELSGGERAVAPGGQPVGNAESAEYAHALAECARALQPRALRVWYLRVFHDMASRDIADHPTVGLKPSHVDVILHRSREAVRHCMESRGHDTRTMPPGTFVTLWSVFHPLRDEPEQALS
jgi:DNA-directed RNA polymerase specialized sigma24 family protein